MRSWSALLVLGLPIAAPAQATPARWELVEDGRYGDGDTRQEAVISGVGQLARAPDGRIFLVQTVDGAVRVFTPNGQYASSIGRSGDGPGEFRRPLRIGIIADTVWVSDPSHDRVSFFSLAGKFLTSSAVLVRLSGPGYGASLPQALLQDGSAIASPSRTFPRGVTPLFDRVPLVRFTRAGVVRDTLRLLNLRNQAGSVQSTQYGFNFAQPFSDAPLQIAVPNGLGFAVVDRPSATRPGNATFTVTRYGPTGARVFERSHGYVPVPLSDQLVDSLTATVTPRLPPDAPRIDPKLVRSALYRPSSLTPVSDAVVGEDGAMWLRGEETGKSTITYRVLTSTGDLGATVSVPSTLSIKYATASHVWAFDTADDIVLVRYRIRR